MTDKDAVFKNSKIFSLIRLKADCKIAPVRVDFTPPHLPAIPPTSIVPAFNPDRAHCTPAFLLPADQKYYHENLAFEEAQFDERIQRSLREAGMVGGTGREEDVRMAAPSSTYCQICQEKFQDYFAHIITPAHRTRESHADASLLIHALCAALAHLPPARPKPIRKQRREERQQPHRKLNKGKKKEIEGEERHAKGQNFSTGLVEDSSLVFKE